MTIFVGRETKTHILQTKRKETNSLMLALLSIIVLLEFKKPFKAVCPRMDLGEQPVSGAAQRCRQRWFRSWLRHDRMTVAMALAERTHHSSRGQMIARPGVWGHERRRSGTPTPQPELFSLYEEEPGGSGQDRIATLSVPQERDLLRTVQQIVDAVPLVPQMVECLPDVLQFFDALIPDPDQEIEVPKILSEDVPLRAVLRDTQLVGQLVEVPTILSCASLLFLQVMQQIAEQNVVIPAVGGQSSSSARWCWRSSRFTPWTEFNSVFGADRRVC